jgi:hypothetical protein
VASKVIPRETTAPTNDQNTPDARLNATTLSCERTTVFGHPTAFGHPTVIVLPFLRSQANGVQSFAATSRLELKPSSEFTKV